MKKINYFGKEYEVEDDVNYVATDADGSVSGYKGVPNRTPAYWSAMEYYYWIGFDENIDAYWKNSLRQVKDIVMKENELKVGDKAELLDDCNGFKKGQVVEVYELRPDGVHLFKGDNSIYNFCNGMKGAYLSECEYKKLGDSLDSSHEKLEMANERKPHPHADLMLKYAMIAQYDDKPWESFECDLGCQTWCDMVDMTFHSGFNYRLKPQEPKIQVGQIWVSEEGIVVLVSTIENPVRVNTIHALGGIKIHWQFSHNEFLQNFKRKE